MLIIWSSDGFYDIIQLRLLLIAPEHYWFVGYYPTNVVLNMALYRTRIGLIILY